MTDFFTLTLLVRVVASFFASLGFAVMFRIHRRHLAVISLGGAITYFLYDLVLFFSASCFVAGLLSTVFAALFSEILARVRHAPTVVFLLPCVIPTIPGGNLYYAMRYLLAEESVLALDNLRITLQVALGVAGGIIIVSVFFGILMDHITANKKKKKTKVNKTQKRYNKRYTMSIEKAKEHLRKYGLDSRVLEFDVSSATVELAAVALGVTGAHITKTLSFLLDDGPILICMAGDAKVDNAKYKAYFGKKAKMLTPEEAVELVGHAVGGVCPFGIREGVRVYLDVSLRRFDVVYPAAGSSNSAIPLSPEELERASECLGWIDVTKGWEGAL